MKQQNYKEPLIRILVLALVVIIMRSIKNGLGTAFSFQGIVAPPNNIFAFHRFALLQVFLGLVILFVLLNRDTILKLKFEPFQFKKVIPSMLLSLTFFLSYYGINLLYNLVLQSYDIIVSLIGFGFMGLYLYFLLEVVFGKKYLKTFYFTYKSDLWKYALFFVGGTIALILLLRQWEIFSGIVTVILTLIFQPFYPTQFRFLADGPFLNVGGFAVSIGESCSGIDSMLLFAAFFLAIIALDFKKVNKKRAALLFVLGFIGVYLVNILRLFLLMLVGIHISPEFAVGLFHTNAGWLLFVIYFLAFYALTKKWLYAKKDLKEDVKKTGAKQIVGVKKK